MATSPNYGWSEPDNTDLVKNGALAIRTLGNAIDTSVWNVGFGQAGKNKTINAAMQVWQRGTSFAITTPAYTADRWQAARGGNVAGTTITRQLTGDNTNLPDIQYCMRIARDSGNTSTNIMYLAQPMESANTIPLAGKTVTVSFYARRGANFSPSSSQINVKLQSGTGTDQNNLTAGYSGSVNVTNQNVTLTTTWQRFSSSGTVPTTSTELGYLIETTPTGTAGAADFYEITGFQVEVGSKATPFQTTSGGSIQGELAMCQRYYFRLTAPDLYSNFGVGFANNSTSSRITINLPVTLRTKPSTSIDFSTLALYDGTSVVTPTSITLAETSQNSPAINCSFSSPTITANRPYNLISNNSTSAFLAFSAEL
jgi:hypothetical protein